MANLTIKNVEIKGISACIPKKIEENKDYPYFVEGEAEKVIKLTGIERRHVSDLGVTPSDMCYNAADKLISELGWEKDSIDVLLFDCPIKDFIQPDTACILQDRLGLKKSTMCFDMTLACSGWGYGLSVIASILSSGCLKRGIMLSGDLPTKTSAFSDKSTYPLFSDAGSATAFEYNIDAPDIFINLGTDGSGWQSLIMRDGLARYPFNEESLTVKDFGNGIIRNEVNLSMNGMDVFGFAIKRAPRSIASLLDYSGKTVDDVDNFFLHQANLYMDKKIIKKAKLAEEKVPISISDFGNTTTSSVPVGVVTKRREDLMNNKRKNISCNFGVGLSWSSVYFETDHIIIPEIIEI